MFNPDIWLGFSLLDMGAFHFNSFTNMFLNPECHTAIDFKWKLIAADFETTLFIPG